MQAAGIICEYNPFHNGHGLLINRTRELTGLPVVCIMSGNFVQRGEPACINKFARARTAVECGADLVFELPVPWACATAERFSYGAVNLFASLGIVSHLTFGSECADIERIKNAAALLDNPEVNEALRKHMTDGLSYAAARQLAVSDADSAAGEILASPNDILGVEYVRAILRGGFNITPVCVKREGAMHDGGAVGEIASASHIRRLLTDGRMDEAFNFMPKTSVNVVIREFAEGRAPLNLNRYDAMVMSALRRMNARDFATLPDISEGLEYRLERAAKKAVDIRGFCELVKTKRYSYSRIRRLCAAAFLSLRADLNEAPVPYARVLAFNNAGRSLLREIKNIPVITKASDGKIYGGAILKYLEIEALADDLYTLLYPDTVNRQGGQGWTNSPVYVKDDYKG